MLSIKQSSLDEATQQSIQRFVDIVRTQYPISQVVLFGSRARALRSSDSDADLMLLH